MVCGPKGSEEDAAKQCSACGRRGALVDLPGRGEKYCWECSADVATSILLTTEIDAATVAGRDAEELIKEFGRLSGRLLARAQAR